MAQESRLSGTTNEEEVYRRHAPQIYAYLLRHLPSQQDAEDLLLEVFIAFLEHGSSLDGNERRLAPYLQTIARNKMADYYRQRGKSQQIPLEDIAETIYEAEELAPEQRVLASEKYAKLHQAISTLPEIQQTILQLRFVHGMRCKEIAQTVAKSENAVRMILCRSLKQLKSLSPIYEER